MAADINPYIEVSINPSPEDRNLAVLFAGESQTHANHILGPQVLDYTLVHIALSGKGFFASRDKRYDLEKGDSFFIFPGELVSYGSDRIDPWRYRWIALKGEHVEPLLGMAGITRELPIQRGGRSHRIATFFRLIKQIIQAADQRVQLRVEGYVRLVVAEYMDSQDRVFSPHQPLSMMQQQVEQAIRWFTLQYPQPISMETVASTLGYHRTHFSKIFKEHTGLAPMQYLTKVRMEKAQLLLLKEPLTIQQVASSVGYTDALYFSKQFKKWFGCSPSEYRDKHQNRISSTE